MTFRVLAAVFAGAVAAAATGAGASARPRSPIESHLSADWHEPALVCASRLDPQTATKGRTRAYHLAAISPPALLPSGLLPLPSPDAATATWVGPDLAKPRTPIASHRCPRGPPGRDSTFIES